MARVSNISHALKKRVAQTKVLLMDVDGAMKDGSMTLLSQPDGTALQVRLDQQISRSGRYFRQSHCRNSQEQARRLTRGPAVRTPTIATSQIEMNAPGLSRQAAIRFKYYP